MLDPLLLLSGAVTGLMIGLTGVGGGSLLTPLLILVGVRPSVAVGTDLAFAAITKVLGTVGHLRSGTVDLRVTLGLAMGSLPASVVGSYASLYLSGMHGEELVRKALGFALLLAAIATLLRLMGLRFGASGVHRPRMLLLTPLGATVGFLVGMTSVGAGSVLMAALIMLGLVPIRKMVGTDIAHGAVLAAVAASAHGWAGSIHPDILGSLLMGALPGVVLGTWLCGRVPERPLRLGIALALALAGMRLL